MPVCTSCTYPVSHLYTSYATAYNIRLEQCPNCKAFADPYVEHDNLIVLLDLILLKRDVLRHLIYNHGSEPRRIINDSEVKLMPSWEGMSRLRWRYIIELGLGLMLADSFVRWTRRYPLKRLDTTERMRWSSGLLYDFGRTFLSCVGETASFQLGILLSILAVGPVVSWLRRKAWLQTPRIRVTFELSYVPMALFYASLTKFFLLLLLSIWSVDSQSDGSRAYASVLDGQISFWQLLDDSVLDREWMVRSVLGGMSAGFGLRVVLDYPPIFITLMIIAGWAAKIGYVLAAEHWLRALVVPQSGWQLYSIP